MNRHTNDSLCLILPRGLVLGDSRLLGLGFVVVKDPQNAIFVPAFRKSFLIHGLFGRMRFIDGAARLHGRFVDD